MYKITKLFKNRYFKILFVFVFSFLVTFYTFLDVKKETSNAIAPAIAVAPAVTEALVVALVALGVTYVSYELINYTIQELGNEAKYSATSSIVSRLNEDFEKQKEDEEQNGGDGNGKKKFTFGAKDLLDLAQTMYDILNKDSNDIKVDVMKECSYGLNSFNVAHPGYGKFNVVASIPLPLFSRLVPFSDPLYSDNNYYSVSNAPPYPNEFYQTSAEWLDARTYNGKSHTVVIYTYGDPYDNVYYVNACVVPNSNLWNFPTGTYSVRPQQLYRLTKPCSVNVKVEWEQKNIPKGVGSISGSSYPNTVTIPRSTLGDTTNVSVPPSIQDGVTVVVPPNPTKDLGLPSVANVDSSSPPLTISQTGATLQDSKNRDIDVSTLETGTTESGILNSILSFFGNFFGKLADLFGLLLKSLFIPSDTYFTNYFDDIKNAFSTKLKADDYIKIFQPDFGNKKIDNIKVNFFSTECTIVNFDYFYENKPSFDKWSRGVFYALLGIYNYSQIYRLIRGTAYSSVGKEEGGKKK